MWNSKSFLIVVLFLIGCAAAGAQERPQPELTQISTIDALLAGDYDGSMTVGKLKELGDFGIGTYNGLDGELIARNGHFYQSDLNAKIHLADNSLFIPYADVTFFRPGKQLAVEVLPNYEAIKSFINQHLESANVFYAIMIEGEFSNMRIRSVAKQTKPYRPMADFITQEQKIVELHDMQGAVIGFKSPPYVQGIGVAGYHFHFVSADGTTGGHVLDLSIAQATMSVQEIRDFRLMLPPTESFDQVSLGTNRSRELQQVEH